MATIKTDSCWEKNRLPHWLLYEARSMLSFTIQYTLYSWGSSVVDTDRAPCFFELHAHTAFSSSSHWLLNKYHITIHDPHVSYSDISATSIVFNETNNSKNNSGMDQSFKQIDLFLPPSVRLYVWCAMDHHQHWVFGDLSAPSFVTGIHLSLLIPIPIRFQLWCGWQTKPTTTACLFVYDR